MTESDVQQQAPTVWRPRCVERTGRECRDCVECLSQHPAGRTCNDCVHAPRCKAVFGVHGDEHFCQWAPSRAAFRAATPEVPHG